MIAMLVVGCVLLPAITVWEIKFAKHPVLASRLLKNRTVLIAAWIGFFDFVRTCISMVSMRAFLLVAADSHPRTTVLVLLVHRVPVLVHLDHQGMVRLPLLPAIVAAMHPTGH